MYAPSDVKQRRYRPLITEALEWMGEFERTEGLLLATSVIVLLEIWFFLAYEIYERAPKLYSKIKFHYYTFPNDLSNQ